MRVLIACEFSGIVREAFRKRGHEAWSCDLIASEDGPDWHYEGDVRNLFTNGCVPPFDLVIAHPPCTDLAVSGARWFAEKGESQQKAVDFFMFFAALDAKYVAIENPIGIMSTRWRKPDQIIQPWMFGHGETKATCLWLKGLPKLIPTDIVEGRTPRVHYASPGPNRWKERSRTLPGIAQAMADQWRNL